MADNVTLHDGFATMDQAIRKIEAVMERMYQPIRRETRETVKNFNKKCRKPERMITDLSDDQQYSQRYASVNCKIYVLLL